MRFTIKNMQNLQILAKAGDLKTVVRVAFAYDYARGEITQALRFVAPDSIALYGEMETEIRALWITEPRQAYALGERMLAWMARPRWIISFDTGIEHALLPTGEDIELLHPLIPADGVQTTTVLDSETDYGQAVVRIYTEIPAGPVPRIVMTTLSTAFDN